jgi:glycerophosphoryl diester phosphodiesterase
MTSQVPRPFYIIGHNPNTIDAVNAVLDAGANAIEPDVNVYEDRPNDLCISHDEGDESAPSLLQFLTDLRVVADQRKELALVMFDCKEKVATPELGVALLSAIRTFLTSETGLNVIVSVGSFKLGGIFDFIATDQRPREGLMIDEEDDPVAVAGFFESRGVTNICYGNGEFVAGVDADVRSTIERATGLKAAYDDIRFVYVWTLGSQGSMREYIRVGVDGIIVNDVKALVQVVGELEFAGSIRLANRSDNPFATQIPGVGLTVRTAGNIGKAGTDANITFTVNGDQGWVGKVVNADLIGRFEQGETNYVALLGFEIGTPHSITISIDDQGNSPAWYLDGIVATKAGRSQLFAFNQWIYPGTGVTRAAVQSFSVRSTASLYGQSAPISIKNSIFGPGSKGSRSLREQLIWLELEAPSLTISA